MDEIWERAVETALDGQTDVASVRNLTLDGAVKCIHGRLPPPSLLEKFYNLQHLSIANIGVSSLEQFPCLRNLQKLILSDNRIAGGLEFLVEAGLESLRDLDLSNNRIHDIHDLRPLAELRLVSLDLYECPVTRVKDYRSRVFGLIRSLKYLDKMDAEENERPESDDEEEEEEDDPGSGEIDGDGEERTYTVSYGHRGGSDGVVEVDEDEESDADEETEIVRGANGVSRVGDGGMNHHSNGFRVESVDRDDDDDGVEGEDDEDNVMVEEIDEDEVEDDDVVEVHEIEDSDDDEDGVDDDDEDGDDDDEEDDDDDEEVDNDEGGFGEPESTGRLTSTEGEIDGHEQGEDDADEDDNGETGEEELGFEEEGDFDEEEDAEDEEDDCDTGYLVQPVVQGGVGDAGNRVEGNEDGDCQLEDEVEDEDDDDEDGEVQELPEPPCHKRKRDEDSDEDDADDVEDYKSSKRQ